MSPKMPRDEMPFRPTLQPYLRELTPSISVSTYLSHYRKVVLRIIGSDGPGAVENGNSDIIAEEFTPN